MTPLQLEVRTVILYLGLLQERPISDRYYFIMSATWIAQSLVTRETVVVKPFKSLVHLVNHDMICKMKLLSIKKHSNLFWVTCLSINVAQFFHILLHKMEFQMEFRNLGLDAKLTLNIYGRRYQCQLWLSLSLDVFILKVKGWNPSSWYQPLPLGPH